MLRRTQDSVNKRMTRVRKHTGRVNEHTGDVREVSRVFQTMTVCRSAGLSFATTRRFGENS